MATAHDVAAYILERHGEVTTMKLQKLLYYAQGWSLAWDGVPLFEEPISAWANGPVIYDVFDRHRGQFTVSSWQGDTSRLTEPQKETIDAVLDGYGHLSGQQLSDKTHFERPWLEARGDLPPGAYGATPIDLDVMQDFFGGLDQLNQA